MESKIINFLTKSSNVVKRIRFQSLRQMNRIYCQLHHYGFTDDQIQLCLTHVHKQTCDLINIPKVSSKRTNFAPILFQCFQWLCINVSDSDLPELLTEKRKCTLEKEYHEKQHTKISTQKTKIITKNKHKKSTGNKNKNTKTISSNNCQLVVKNNIEQLPKK